MNVIEETIEATLDSNHQPRLPPGPVRVTIRSAAPVRPRRGLADVIREIHTDQVARRFHGLTTEQHRQREAEIEAENDEYDREMERIGALHSPLEGQKCFAPS